MYSYAETNVAPRNQRQIEPILVRLMKDRSEVTAPLFVRRVQAAPLPGRPLHAADGVRHNGSPRDRMRHQVQLGEGAPGWHGRMPTDRYQPLGK